MRLRYLSLVVVNHEGGGLQICTWIASNSYEYEHIGFYEAAQAPSLVEK